jgi:hypothetical protein
MTRYTAASAIGLALVLLFATPAAASTPTISYSIDGIVGTNSWYRGSTHGDNVVVHWTVSLNATATNCLAAVTVPGPTGGTTLSCWAENSDGRATAVTRVIKIDAAAPTGVTAHLARPPDFNGWYNHPVAIRWSGSDATSGIAYCASGTYRGPDNGAAAVNGGCADKAGNSAGFQVHLAYDATPPTLGKVTEESTAAADILSWSSSSASDRIVVRRAVRGHKKHSTVFDGSASGFTDKNAHPGTQYVYSVQSFDQAGNASRVVPITARLKILTLRKTRYVPIAAPNPILRWKRARGADYYNIQLYRGARRIYAAWPTMHQVGLSATWKWSGRRFRLSPGRYRWYVWAGLGPRRAAQYRMVGSERFTIPRD